MTIRVLTNGSEIRVFQDSRVIIADIADVTETENELIFIRDLKNSGYKELK